MDLEMDKPGKAIKGVVVGDSYIGKTAIIETYTQKRFPTEYKATVFDSYPADIEVGGYKTKMIIWDSSGLETYDHLRKLTYPDADVIIICFDLTNQASYENVSSVWIPELRGGIRQTTPIILVGTKSELRSEAGRRNKSFTYKQGVQLAKEIGAAKYLECSARNNEGLEAVFHEAAKEGLGWGNKK